MISGYFDEDKRPYIEARLIIQRLAVDGFVQFLVDTGSDSTALHPMDGQRLQCRFDLLGDPYDVTGIGGGGEYYPEGGTTIILAGVEMPYLFENLTIDIAKPGGESDDLPSLLGNDLLEHLRMDYHRSAGQLHFYPLD